MVLVRDLGGKAYKVIRVRPFLHEHGIYTDRTIQFPTASIDEDGILCLNLRDRPPGAKSLQAPRTAEMMKYATAIKCIAAGLMRWKSEDSRTLDCLFRDKSG